jgi:hypothetical protein
MFAVASQANDMFNDAVHHGNYTVIRCLATFAALGVYVAPDSEIVGWSGVGGHRILYGKSPKAALRGLLSAFYVAAHL